MNYNDIHDRLLRLYESIDRRFDENIEDYLQWETSRSIFYKEDHYSFGVNDKNKVLNNILLIVHNLANMKDHLKNMAASIGIQPQDIEDEIQKSKHLKIVIDLANQEKHGTPLKKTRSGTHPRIENLTAGLQIDAMNTMATVNFLNGKVNVEGANSHKIAIDADIVDENGNKLCDLDELIASSCAKWEEIIEIYSLKS